MIGGVAGLVALLVAGFVFGRLRRRRVSTPPARLARGRTQAALVLALVAFPFVTLMLAKLFNSDVLGWVFGLTLMLGLALVPCVAIFYVGLLLGSRGAGRRAAQPAAVADMVVQIGRGTVHASDDAPPKQISISPSTTLREMVALAIADRYLPGISGGKASWIVESSGLGASVGAGAAATAGVTAGTHAAFHAETSLRPIAVCAQEWTEVQFLAAADASVAAHFGTTPPRLNFRYRRQDDPDAVVASLRAAHR